MQIDRLHFKSKLLDQRESEAMKREGERETRLPFNDKERSSSDIICSSSRQTLRFVCVCACVSIKTAFSLFLISHH